MAALKKRRARFFAATLVALSTSVSLLLAEGAARLWERRLFPVLYHPYGAGPVKRARRIYRGSLLLGYEPVPGVDGYNALGFLNPDYPIAKRPGVLRVMLAGDSLAEQYGHLLQQELDARGRRAEIWNLAVGGYNLGQYVRRLLKLGLRYEPDLILLFHCLNDPAQGFGAMVRTEQGIFALRWWFPGDWKRVPLPWLWQPSALYRLLLIRVLAWRFDRGGLQPIPSKDEFVAAHLDDAAAAARERGVPIRAVVFPYLKPDAAYESWDRENLAILRKALKEAGIPFLDLHSAFPSATRARYRQLRQSDDDIHMDHAGGKKAMRLVADWLDPIFRRAHNRGTR